MPSLTRKRGAPPDSNSSTAVKRARRANKESHESGSDDNGIEPPTEQVPVQETSKKATKTRRAKPAPRPSGTDELGGKISAPQEIKHEEESNDIATTKTPKKGGSRVKTKKISVKEEIEEEETDVEAMQDPPKKARKRKVANQEEEKAEQARDEPTPKKAKGKRKTKEEKEAEAMPLAARSIGLRMFIGAHVSGAKGGLSRPAVGCI